jgi:hypothetical protein
MINVDHVSFLNLFLPFSENSYFGTNVFSSSPRIIRMIKPRRMRWAGHVAHMGEKRNAYRLSAGKPEGKTPLERPRQRWKDNIKMYLKRNRMGWYGLD